MSKKISFFHACRKSPHCQTPNVQYSKAVNMQENHPLHSESLRASCSALSVERRSLPAKHFLHIESVRTLNGGSWYGILPEHSHRHFRSSCGHSGWGCEQPGKRLDLQLLCSPPVLSCSHWQLCGFVAQPLFPRLISGQNYVPLLTGIFFLRELSSNNCLHNVHRRSKQRSYLPEHP